MCSLRSMAEMSAPSPTRESGTMKRARVTLWVITLMVAGTAHADQIRLKDGTEVSGEIRQRDGDHVLVEFPRSSVVALNGKPLPPPVTVGEKAPDFSATDLAGVTQTLSQSQGHVTLVQFWASWCPFCRKDLPRVKELFAKYQGKGLRLLTISIDQDLEALKKFVQQEQLAYPVIPAATNQQLPDLYESQGVPAYYLIDAKGTIAQLWRGSVTVTQTDLDSAVAMLLPAQS